MDKNVRYGYLDENSSKVRVRMKKGQNIAGWPIGIIYIDDVYYPMLPGNIVNGYTFDFPVRLKAVEGLDIPNLFNCGDSVYDAIMEACLKLQSEGIRAISSACGFFGNYHRQVADALDIPVALSSLVQLPWIETVLKPSQKIGVLTADASSITDRLLIAAESAVSCAKNLSSEDSVQSLNSLVFLKEEESSTTKRLKESL